MRVRPPPTSVAALTETRPVNTPINRAMAPSDWALLVALSLLWGGSFFFNAVAFCRR
jgi:hypothetical protein